MTKQVFYNKLIYKTLHLYYMANYFVHKHQVEASGIELKLYMNLKKPCLNEILYCRLKLIRYVTKNLHLVHLPQVSKAAVIPHVKNEVTFGVVSGILGSHLCPNHHQSKNDSYFKLLIYFK